VFRRFDSERGFGVDTSDVLKIQLDPNLKISWAWAPDGLHLAWIISDATDGVIHVASLQQPGSDRNTSQGREDRVLQTHLSHLHALNFSPDGKRCYVTTHLPASWKIIYVNGAPVTGCSGRAGASVLPKRGLRPMVAISHSWNWSKTATCGC
jgi:WD40 repeat protein